MEKNNHVIKVTLNNKSIRTLGIWVSSDTNHNFIKKQIKDEIQIACTMLKRKHITTARDS